MYVNKIIEFDYSLVYMQNDNNLNISIHSGNIQDTFCHNIEKLFSKLHIAD